MTGEQLHDAIGLLPADLLEKTDRLRQSPRKRTVPVVRYLSAAACAAVLLGGALVYRSTMGQPGKDAAVSFAAPAEVMMEEAAMDQGQMQDAQPAQQNAAGSITTDRAAAAESAVRWAAPALEISGEEFRLTLENGEEAALEADCTQVCLTWKTPPEEVHVTVFPEGEAAYAEGVLSFPPEAEACRITASWPEGSGVYILRIQ